ncbi:hypothetical protein LCGC14_0146610 [marine sediment metagenome]|uniref:Uncharacterized protein n=1 Tax=marine sediment metagenome TaxID=412755 RepID=A0A0F9V3I2_9ZZZZ
MADKKIDVIVLGQPNSGKTITAKLIAESLKAFSVFDSVALEDPDWHTQEVKRKIMEQEGLIDVVVKTSQVVRSTKYKDKPRVLVLVDGGVVQGIKSDSPIDAQIIDLDDLEELRSRFITEENKAAIDYREKLEDEYESLPESV